jgi:hypothetical protein
MENKRDPRKMCPHCFHKRPDFLEAGNGGVSWREVVSMPNAILTLASTFGAHLFRVKLNSPEEGWNCGK